VVGGGYDNDLDLLIQADDASLPLVAEDFDAHLIESSALVKGVLDVQADGSEPASGAGSSGSADGSGSVAALAQEPASQTQESDDFLEQMEEDVRAFEAFVQQRGCASAALSEAEAKYAQEMSSDAQEIAQSFGDKFAPMIAFKADYKPVLTNLQKIVEDRLAEVAGFAGCAAEDILRVVRRCCLVALGRSLRLFLDIGFVRNAPQKLRKKSQPKYPYAPLVHKAGKRKLSVLQRPSHTLHRGRFLRPFQHGRAHGAEFGLLQQVHRHCGRVKGHWFSVVTHLRGKGASASRQKQILRSQWGARPSRLKTQPQARPQGRRLRPLLPSCPRPRVTSATTLTKRAPEPI